MGRLADLAGRLTGGPTSPSLLFFLFFILHRLTAQARGSASPPSDGLVRRWLDLLMAMAMATAARAKQVEAGRRRGQRRVRVRETATQPAALGLGWVRRLGRQRGEAGYGLAAAWTPSGGDAGRRRWRGGKASRSGQGSCARACQRGSGVGACMCKVWRVTRDGRTAARRGWAGSNGARRGGTPVARAAWWNGARVRLARQATASKTQARLKSSLD